MLPPEPIARAIERSEALCPFDLTIRADSKRYRLPNRILAVRCTDLSQELPTVSERLRRYRNGQLDVDPAELFLQVRDYIQDLEIADNCHQRALMARHLADLLLRYAMEVEATAPPTPLPDNRPEVQAAPETEPAIDPDALAEEAARSNSAPAT